jgi:hypothetical protein
MLTRLRVSGFKNLLDLDLHFGPFTCIAGVNGAGKSNLFDAVHLLSDLASHSLVDAAQSVRAAGRRAGDVDSLFFRTGGDAVSAMSFAVEMIVPGEAVDDLDRRRRRASPSSTTGSSSPGAGTLPRAVSARSRSSRKSSATSTSARPTSISPFPTGPRPGGGPPSPGCAGPPSSRRKGTATSGS